MSLGYLPTVWTIPSSPHGKQHQHPLDAPPHSLRIHTPYSSILLHTPNPPPSMPPSVSPASKTPIHLPQWKLNNDHASLINYSISSITIFLFPSSFPTLRCISRPRRLPSNPRSGPSLKPLSLTLYNFFNLSVSSPSTTLPA
jgi:hypothetical protein